MEHVELKREEEHWWGRFDAMASPCEVLVDTNERRVAERLVGVVASEARRVERTFSRYRSDNIIHRINHSNGCAVRVDDEVADLLDFAARCYELSDGAFDVTAGVLRRVWRFDGSDSVPDRDAVRELLPHIGWERVTWRRPHITLPAGMEIDLGGFGKEYAVDRALAIVKEHDSAPVLVNFGGDLSVSGPRANGRPWRVGVEHPDAPELAVHRIELPSGALATSGDANRYLLKDGVRYSHVLDPRTGWPVPDAPRSVSVLGANCTEAGLLATLAMLRGNEAEAFLEVQGVRYWCIRA